MVALKHSLFRFDRFQYVFDIYLQNHQVWMEQENKIQEMINYPVSGDAFLNTNNQLYPAPGCLKCL